MDGPMSKARVLDLIDELAAAERRLGEFIAPVRRSSRTVVAWVEGLAKPLALRRRRGEEAEGFLVLRPCSDFECEMVRAATRAERQAYLERLPRVRSILIDDEMGYPAGEAERRLGLNGPHRIGFVQGQRFETIQGRFDGCNVWFEAVVERRRARALREVFDEAPTVEAVRRVPGLTPAHRAGVELLLERERARVSDWTEERLRQALSHAGGMLLEWQERPDHYWVRWEVDGQVHTSAVGKDSLEVVTAGVCLSGRDADFDLTSLVSVMREGARRHWGGRG